MKSKFRLLAVALIAGGTMFAQSRLSIGIGVGGYGPGDYPPPAYSQYQPPCPGPGYTWVDGYWSPAGGHRSWVAGFWRAPVVSYNRGYVAPRYDNSFRGHDRDDHHDRDRGRDRGDRHDDRGFRR